MKITSIFIFRRKNDIVQDGNPGNILLFAMCMVKLYTLDLVIRF